MSFLKNLFTRGRSDRPKDGRGDDEGFDVPVTLDLERRKEQLLELERALDALATEMRREQSTDNPGWRARVNEYSRLAGDAMTLRRGTPDREQLLDLVFEIRPVFSGEIPAGMEQLGPLQDKVISLAGQLQELLPGERG